LIAIENGNHEVTGSRLPAPQFIHSDDSISDRITLGTEKTPCQIHYITMRAKNSRHILNDYNLSAQRDCNCGGCHEKIIPRIIPPRMIVEVRVALAWGAGNKEVGRSDFRS